MNTKVNTKKVQNAIENYDGLYLEWRDVTLCAEYDSDFEWGDPVDDPESPAGFYYPNHGRYVLRGYGWEGLRNTVSFDTIEELAAEMKSYQDLRYWRYAIEEA